jgi:hypothetical protein
MAHAADAAEPSAAVGVEQVVGAEDGVEAGSGLVGLTDTDEPRRIIGAWHASPAIVQFRQVAAGQWPVVAPPHGTERSHVTRRIRVIHADDVDLDIMRARPPGSQGGDVSQSLVG